MVDLPPEEAIKFREICTSSGWARLCRSRNPDLKIYRSQDVVHSTDFARHQSGKGEIPSQYC